MSDASEDRNGGGEGTATDADVVLTLPDELRAAFKDPLGTVETDAGALLSAAGRPLITVGDVVTYHVLKAGRRPDVAIVDWRTERREVDDAIARVVDDARASGATVEGVPNPPATLSAPLLSAIREAIDAEEPYTIVVDGEEDLATLPALLAAPPGASVVYGQPGEGMVHVHATGEVRRRTRDLVDRMEGDHARLDALLALE